MCPNPLLHRPSEAAAGGIAVASFGVRAAAAAFAADPMVVSRDIGQAFLGDGGVLSKQVMPDLLHLSAPAYRIWAESIVKDVDAALAAPR